MRCRSLPASAFAISEAVFSLLGMSSIFTARKNAKVLLGSGCSKGESKGFPPHCKIAKLHPTGVPNGIEP